MIILADALHSLAPNSEWETDSFVVTAWKSTDIPQPSQEEIDAEVVRLQAEYDAQEYARNRATAYASTGDQLDMQYWDSVNDTTTWKDHIASVKDQFPKV